MPDRKRLRACLSGWWGQKKVLVSRKRKQHLELCLTTVWQEPPYILQGPFYLCRFIMKRRVRLVWFHCSLLWRRWGTCFSVHSSNKLSRVNGKYGRKPKCEACKKHFRKNCHFCKKLSMVQLPSLRCARSHFAGTGIIFVQIIRIGTIVASTRFDEIWKEIRKII